MLTMIISPATSLRGEAVLPGDKSISHRAALLASIADGPSRISNFGTSADCAATVKCMREMGVKIERDGGELAVSGVGKDGLSAPAGVLDCENSGTTMRLMSGIVAGQSFTSTLTGDHSLQGRPMKRVIDPLTKMGAEIESRDGFAPMTKKGRRPLAAIDYEPSAASAQLKSCVLLAGLNSDGVTSVLERTPTRNHSELMLRWLGVDVAENTEENGRRISVSGDARLSARDIQVPADLSSAAFFIVAAGFLEGSELSLPGVGVNGSRRAVVDVLREIGVDIKVTLIREVCNEPVADLVIRGQGSVGGDPIRLGGEVIANLIDEIPILAIAGTRLKGGLEIRDAAELRIKESDRISAVVQNLKRMNADVEEFEDGFRVGQSALTGAEIDSFGDHRIAMAFAVAGLFAKGDTVISGAESAAVSFPGFFDTLRSVIY